MVALLSVLAALALGGSAAAQDEDAPQGVSWQSAGDSYSSGEGVYGNEGDCAQSDQAYGPATVKALRERWQIDNETFTACTGHLVEDYFHARSNGGRSLWQWGTDQGGPDRVDVITMSFGGNDIGFADVIHDCLVGLSDSWGELIAGGVASSLTGCDLSEAELNARTDHLLDPPRRGCTTSRRVDKAYDCDIALEGRRGSIIDFYYDVVTNHLTPRGRLYIVGYPRIFADTDQWPAWSAAACAGVKRGDTEKLGRSAEYLNNKLQEAIRRANEALGEERVIFVDRFAYYRDGQHELCGRGEDWLNGVARNAGDGRRVRFETSFHPNAAGHEGVAAELVGIVDATFPREEAPAADGPTWDEIKNASIPAMCTHPPTTLVEGRDVTLAESQGHFSLQRTLRNGQPGLVTGVPSEAGPLTAVVVSCNAGGVGWPNQVMFFSEGGVYYAHTDFLDADWKSAGLIAPGRDGISGIWLRGSEVEIYTSAEHQSDPSCCPTGSALVRMRAENGTIRITSLTEDVGD